MLNNVEPPIFKCIATLGEAPIKTTEPTNTFNSRHALNEEQYLEQIKYKQAANQLFHLDAT